MNENAKEILDAISRVTKERENFGKAKAPAPVSPPVATAPVVRSTPTGSMSVEMEDQSEDSDGSILLFWYDEEDARKFAQVSPGIYPMKSATSLAKHIDFHNEEEKQNALQEIAGIVERFENEIPEVRSRGAYIIGIGKMVKVEVQKRIVLK